MFIGQKEVDRVESSTVYFVDGTQKEYAPKQLEYLITEEDKEPTEYVQHIMNNIMPEVQTVLDEKLEEIETVGKILKIVEEHDLTQEEANRLTTSIINNRIHAHNKFMEKKVWKQIAKFQEDIKRYEWVVKTLKDSHNRALVIAVGKALWTYVEWEYFEDYWNNIRISHIKPFI